MTGRVAVLARDAWLLGIASAAALGIATISLVRAAASTVGDVVDGARVQDHFAEAELTASLYAFVLRGRLVHVDTLFVELASFVVILAIAAIVLRRTASTESS